MNRSYRIAGRIAGATLFVSILSSMTYAQPPHRGGLPPGLQKKLERGENLPPGWSNRAVVHKHGYDEPGYSQNGYVESNYDQYESEYVEDKVYRIIKDARDLMSIVPR